MSHGFAGRHQLTAGIPERHVALGVPAPASVTVTVSADPGVAALQAWDDLAQRTPGTDVTQLSAWARVRALYCYTPLYVMAHRTGELVGGAQILVRRLPLVGSIGYLPYGRWSTPRAATRPRFGVSWPTACGSGAATGCAACSCSPLRARTTSPMRCCSAVSARRAPE
jgi:hypothetical protein